GTVGRARRRHEAGGQFANGGFPHLRVVGEVVEGHEVEGGAPGPVRGVVAIEAVLLDYGPALVGLFAGAGRCCRACGHAKQPRCERSEASRTPGFFPPKHPDCHSPYLGESPDRRSSLILRPSHRNTLGKRSTQKGRCFMEPRSVPACLPAGSRCFAMWRVGPFLRPGCRMSPMRGRGEVAPSAAYIQSTREQNESKDLQCETTPIVSSDTVPDSLCSLF